MKGRSEDIERVESNMQSIRKQVAVAKLNLSKVNILAPFEGIIITKEIEQGSFAEAGTPILVMIGSERLKAVLEIPQSYKNKLKQLNGAGFLARELGLNFKYGRNLSRLIRVIPDANIYSGNIKVQIDLPDPNPSLFSGFTLDSKLNFGIRKNVLHVPAVSLVIGVKGTLVYIVKDGQIIIIDEQTGRQLPGRRFADGLHQSLEAKEKVEIQAENQTLASITYQNYFKLYKKLCGCTGTAITEAQEFYEIYNLNVLTIPTNKKMIRKDWNDQIFRTEKEKNNSIVSKVLECSKKGQPVLIFTSSINKSEQYSKILNSHSIKHTVLNAKNHEREAEIIANAGKTNSVIITTSISGRGVDIQLGGKKESLPENELNKEKEKVKTLGGLFVIGTERMESRRVDNQARGRSGRQGDEGSSVFYVSLEDDLMRIFGSESMNNMLEKLGLKDGESIDHPWINKALERAQQKVEARNFDIRKTLIKFDIAPPAPELIKIESGSAFMPLNDANLSLIKFLKLRSPCGSGYGANTFPSLEIISLVVSANCA